VSASAAGESVDIYGACVRAWTAQIDRALSGDVHSPSTPETQFVGRRRAVHCVRRALKAGSASVCICLHDGVARRDGSVDGKEMRGETDERKEGTGRRRDGEMDMRAQADIALLR